MRYPVPENPTELLTPTKMPARSNSIFPARLASALKDLDPTTCWVVSVAIPHPPSTARATDRGPQILLVRRATHELNFPNCWEIPGGYMEAGETVRQYLKCETLAETGLQIDMILGELEEMKWESRKTGGKEIVQMSFAATVISIRDGDGVIIVLNPDKHSEWMWARKEEVEREEMREEMRIVVRNGLGFFHDIAADNRIQ